MQEDLADEGLEALLKATLSPHTQSPNATLNPKTQSPESSTLIPELNPLTAKP